MSHPSPPPAPPGRLNDAQLAMILEELERRGVKGNCPRCGNSDFGLQPFISMIQIQGDLDSVTLGGNSIPSAVTVCDRCGFLSLHALGPLGLLENPRFRAGGYGIRP